VASLDVASLSTCEARSCQESCQESCDEFEALVDADPFDDWLCAAISEFKVAGDICPPAPNPEAAAELADAEVELAIWNGSTALKPVDDGEDALDEVSALTASSAAVAAPRANSMTKLRPLPLHAAHLPRADDEQAPCHPEKPSKIAAFHLPNGSAPPAIDAAAAEFSPSRRSLAGAGNGAMNVFHRDATKLMST
jgi:hypothetical protein